MKAVRIPGHVIDAIVAHARAALPDECCGLLIGSTETIHRSVPARNLAASPTRYLMDPSDHFAAIRSARAAGLSVMGAYHSHPGAPAVPSRRDLDEAWDADFVHVIVSLAQGHTREDLRAYVLSDDRATPLEIVRDQ
jgi:[CysO sulfur-carrier protein]-S-L-cysteine hydrolase